MNSSSHVNHWYNIAKTLHDKKDDTDLLAAGIYNTSVNEYPFQGEFNYDTEEYAKFDPFEDSWWLTPGEGRGPHPSAN